MVKFPTYFMVSFQIQYLKKNQANIVHTPSDLLQLPTHVWVRLFLSSLFWFSQIFFYCRQTPLSLPPLPSSSPLFIIPVSCLLSYFPGNTKAFILVVSLNSLEYCIEIPQTRAEAYIDHNKDNPKFAPTHKTHISSRFFLPSPIIICNQLL